MFKRIEEDVIEIKIISKKNQINLSKFQFEFRSV